MTPANASRYICSAMHMNVFQALADPTRRRIVEVLCGGEQAVNDLVDRVAIHQSGVSRHLGILAESGFVRMRPEGSKRLYSLRPERFRELDKWVDRYRALWDARLDRLGAALERKRNAGSAARKERVS